MLLLSKHSSNHSLLCIWKNFSLKFDEPMHGKIRTTVYAAAQEIVFDDTSAEVKMDLIRHY
jgi:hypothetical protein